MTGCTTCGGFGQHHDPIAHDWAPAWVICETCKGEQTIRRGEFDVDCPDCDGDGGWEP
jgi:DnaJ-class molecular chaperone